jgi:cob(I)alamin adenosyltransferase
MEVTVMKRIYTKGGDTGETGLLYGGRVSKADPRCEAYGSIDEAVSALGLARALSHDSQVQEVVIKLQRELFTLGAELATDAAEYAKLQQHFSTVTPEMTTHLEAVIDVLAEQVQLPRAFVVPGGSAASGALDLARAVLRRAERRTVALHEQKLLLNAEVLRYLNRATDLVFMLARFEDRHISAEYLTNPGRGD